MNIQTYVIDLSLAAIAIGLYLHVSDCERENLSRAKLDEHVAAVSPGEKPLTSQQGEVLGSAGRDVMSPTADCDHANATLRGCPDLHDGNRAPADVRDADAFHGTNDAHAVTTLTHRREDADIGPVPPRLAKVSHERVDEVRERDERADGNED